MLFLVLAAFADVDVDHCSLSDGKNGIYKGHRNVPLLLLFPLHHSSHEAFQIQTSLSLLIALLSSLSSFELHHHNLFLKHSLIKMKTSIFSAVAFASLAIAAPFSSRQEQTARIELEIEPDTFVQDDVPLDVLFSTADNPRLDSGISARVVSPDGVECQAFDDNENPLGPPFGEEPVQFSDTLVAIGAYFCSASSNNNGNHGHNGNSTGDNNINNQGQARIQLETSPDTFVQEEIPIGVEVSTRGEF